MRIREIEAKTLLQRVKGPDTWFGLTYSMNLYRGCAHQCIYCDTRSACYEIEDFDHEVLVKHNALDLLEKELRAKRVKGTIGLGSINDPYQPVEAERGLTRGALERIAKHRFPVHVLTKSDLVLRDLDLLKQVPRAVVSLTITTTDDALAAVVEPFAPPPSARLRALRALAEAGIEARITLMPILPFIEDAEENVRAIVEAAHTCGVTAIVASFGMTLRDRCRDHYYAKLDERFPGLRERYKRTFGEPYVCPSPSATRLGGLFRELCQRHGIATHVTSYRVSHGEQLSLL
jgi:DNA repair photolyase